MRRPDRITLPLGALVFLLMTTAAPGQSGTERRSQGLKDGVYTVDQAQRGEATFVSLCSPCHAGSQFTDSSFLESWQGRSAFELLDLIRSTMPPERPGRLPPMQYADVVAYILRLNGLPPGDRELPAPAEGVGQGGAAPAAASRSTSSGVYTAAQAARGRDVYGSMCQGCHTPASHSGTPFLRVWGGRTLWELFDYVMTEMPMSDPGVLTDQEGAQLVAYLLQLNGMPAGPNELPTNSAELKQIGFETASVR